MIKIRTVIVLILLVGLASALTGIGLNPIRPLKLNKGKSTKYMFYINPQTEILNKAKIKVNFPDEFDKTAIASSLSCLASSLSYTWKSVPCSYQFSSDSVIVDIGTVKNEQTLVLISQPTNPTTYEMSSYFEVCLMVDTMTTSCNKKFGKVVFPVAPVTNTPAPTALYPKAESLNTRVVGQSSTYEFVFSFSKSYTEGNTVRVTLPPGFETSSSPICQMKGTYNQIINTFVWPDKRTVECQNINKTMHLNESLKVIGILNPTYAGTFGNSADGFILELMKSNTTIVLEELHVQMTVTIDAGALKGSISQANNFIQADVTYTIYLNLLNSLTSTNFIQIRFDNTWLLYKDMCKAISGITMAPSSNLLCNNYTSGSYVYLNVSNFISASVSNQLIFSIKVRSPSTPNTYQVQIETANSNGVLDSMITSVSLNSTEGDYDMLSINAIVAQSNVPVSGTGPLELTFFLNYELPQTNVLTSGKFEVKITPQIPLPDPLINGVLKCYYFNTIPAQSCVWDTTNPNYTFVTINTPLENYYQYSQIPITITTEGAVNSSRIGITIDDIVTRYRFETQAYMHNSTTVPTQVYFSEYVADSIYMPITFYSLTKEVDEKTHLRFEFTSPYNFTIPRTSDLRIKVEFLSGGAWAPNLGYNASSIYKNFPCVYSEDATQTLPPIYNADISCDLYTYLTGPHASLTNSTARGPYIIVSGFTNEMFIGTQVRLEFGGILIGSQTNLKGHIRFSLIEETPDMLTKYIELYYNELSLFDSTSQAIASPTTGVVTDTLANAQINSVTNHTIAYTASQNFFAVIYEFDQISTPSLTNQFVECTSQSLHTTANWCTYLGYPVNHVVEYHQTGTFPTSISSIINITNGVYSGSFTGVARVFTSSYVTILKSAFTVTYTPYTITTATFALAETYIYKGQQIYYTLDFTPIRSTPDNGFVRLILGSNGKFGQSPFCTSTNVSPYVVGLGILCTVENPTTLKIYNINGLTAGNVATFRLRIYSDLASGGNFQSTITVQTHYSVNADPSIVDLLSNHAMSMNPTNYYEPFNSLNINNPRVRNEPPRVNYVGKFQIEFNPSSDILSSNSIKLTLNNHKWNGGIWTTPNNVVTDPMVCMINRIRVGCTYTLSPLTVTMDVAPAGITNGQQNIITLDTEFLSPYNGIKHPSQGGQYNLYLEFLDTSNSTIQKQSFYHRVLPPRLRNFYVNSTVHDVGTENMFYVRIQLGSTMLNAYNHGSLYSRIFIEFPTVDSLGNTLFASDLGGYQVTGQLVGCVTNTWSTYYVDPVSGKRIMCRLIKSEKPGDPVRVEVIHHSAFSSSWRFMEIWIAKVFNPAIAVTSVPISVRMEHVEVSTNNIYELYYDTFDTFMNSQNVGSLTHNTRDCQSHSGTVMQSGPINHEGYFRFYPRVIGSYTTSEGWYYVIDTTKDFKPSSLETRYGNNDCHSSYYYKCLAFPDINYFIIWSKSNNYYVNLYLWFGQAISQQATTMVAKIWSQGRYRGTTTTTISPTCWNQIRSTPTNVNLQATASNYYYEGRRKLEVRIEFQVEEPLPADGTIEIKFPSSVPRIYPHCRSQTNLGSSLTAEGPAYNGQIGCQVQNTRSWVITGFNAMAVNDWVRIVGLIDLPSTHGNLGGGQVITYNNTHATNIRSNGFIIDYYYSSSFFIYVQNAGSMNVESEITMEETLPLRTGYTGPLRFKFSLSSNLNGPNAGQITVRVPGKSTANVAGGFTYNATAKYVCQIVQIFNYEETGCIVTSVVEQNGTNPNILFTMITSSQLSATALYKLVLTTHNGNQPEGLIFPTVAGTYKIDFNFDTTGSTGMAIHNHLYMEVYGTKFTFLQVFPFVTIPGGKNLIWIKLTPSTTISTDHQIIIEVPTKATRGTILFADDLGLGLPDGSIIPIDLMESPFSSGFMKCRLFHGDRNYYKPARIVCGGLTGTVTTSQVLWFSIVIYNPSIPSGERKLSIPFFIYTVEQGTTYYTNFDVAENAVFVRSDYNTKTDVATPVSQNQKLQTSGMYLDMISRNTYTTDSASYYLIYFGFPLRNNGVVSNGCTTTSGTVYGDAIYHSNHWAIICKTTNTNLGVPGGGSTTRNLRIKNFFTPFFYLSSSERTMLTYTFHYNTKYTSVGTITDGYPNEAPKTSSNPTMTMTPLHRSTRLKGSRDDYTFSFTFTTSNTDDLSFVKKIAIIFPVNIDYEFVETDCLEAPGSQVEIASCVMDATNKVIWIYPVEKLTYTSNMPVAIQTRNRAIRNPVVNTTTNINAFTIKYYTWQNITEPSLSPTINDYHCYLKITNFPSSAISHSNNPSSYNEPNFDYIEYPHQRYYEDTPFSSVVHRAPFEMEFYPAVAFSTSSGSNYHMIKISYPSTFGDASMIKIRDLQVFRPICYLANQRIRQCSIDTVNNAITMSFLFSLVTTSKYHIKVSILDSRNADVDGFLSSVAVSNVVLEYKPYGSSWRYTETDQFPTLYSLPSGASTGPFRGIIAGSASYGHTIPSTLNYLNMLLTFNRTDITGLVFQIPSVDTNGNALFNNAGEMSATFLSQSNGGSYPCGNNGFTAGGNVRCILLNGQHDNNGVVTRIIMTEFTISPQMNCRIVFVNPAKNAVYFSVKVKAFGGLSSADNPYGNQYFGEWEFNEIFQTNSAGSTTSNSYVATSYQCPSLTPWRNNTEVYIFSKDTQMGAQRSSVAELKYYDDSSSMTDKHFCEPTLYSSANDYDDLLLMTRSIGGVVTKWAYFITTYQSNTNVSYTSSYGWRLKYLKCKYFANFNIKGYFFYSDTSVNIATNTFTSTHCDGYTSGVSSPSTKYFAMSHPFNNGTDITYVMEFDITATYTSISNFNFRNGDEMVLEISFNNSYWGTIGTCHLLGGIVSTSLAKKAECVKSSNTKIYIKNVAGFSATPNLAASTHNRVKVSFVASASATSGNSYTNFYMQLFSNIDAFNNQYQPIFYQTNALINSNTLSSCYWRDTTACVLIDSNSPRGTFLLQKITDTYLQVAFKPSGNLNFGTTGYYHNFILTFNSFTFGTSCSVSNLVIEASSSSVPGTGHNNSFAATSQTCGADYVEINLNAREWKTWFGSNVDNTWSTSQFLIFYITIAPNAGTADLPNHDHDYVFVQASYNYKSSSGGSLTKSVLRSNEYTPQPLATSATISTLSTNRGAVTELEIKLTSLQTDLGPQNNNYNLVAEFIGSSSWTGSSDPFASYTNTAMQTDDIDCKCIAGANPLSISASSPIVDTVCKRRLPSGSFSNFAIVIGASALSTQDLICFFPEFKIATGMSFSVEMKLIFDDNTYPPERASTSTKYTSRFRTTSNTLSYSGSTPNMNSTYVKGFSSSESPNFYSSVTSVGSTFTGSYTLSGSWSSVVSALNTPFLYINFKSAGPIPIYDFCSNTANFLQCRVYTTHAYVVVAELKSTSTTSYSISNAGVGLLYPPSQFSSSGDFGATIYIGTDRWYASSSLGRSRSNLAPISDNTFMVYSDIYGSKRSNYNTNIFFAINPSSQTLYNNAITGSKMVISWSGLTQTQNCVVWVQNQPAVNLECKVASNSITITSPWFDYTTSNNIFVSLGLTNPSSASTTFTLQLFSEYYSSSRYWMTISRTATYTTDTTYNSMTKVAKSSVVMYPFESRISTVANAPLRIRFKLPSSSVASTNGKFTLTYSQIGYSSAHLCYIIAYSSYAAMMQQTQRSTYKVTCSSSSSTITVTPAVTLTVGSSLYYELVMMPLNINSAGCTAGGCVTQSGYQQTNFDEANFIAYNHKSTPTIISQQVQKLYLYQGSNKIGLQHIFILCVQPRITSLYLSINVNFTSSNNFPDHYMEITLYDISISAFPGFAQGDIIPCQLSSAFLAISARKQPQCRVALANKLNNYIKVRIENIGFLSPQVYWVTLDDIILPTPSSSDNNNKFDISISYMGPSNLKYENYFPEIFQIDNTNSTSPVTGSSYSFNNPALTGFGNPVVGQISFNWPFDSSSSGYETKVALNFNGGYSEVWNDINSVTFVDNVGTYQILWVNTHLNKFVFLMPNKGNGVSTTLNVTALNNPYPYQKELYNKNSTNVIINFYKNHFLANSRTFNQPSFSIFTRNPSLIFINQNLPTNTIDNYGGNTFAPSSTNTLTLTIQFDQTVLNIQTRKLGVIQIKFTSGISYIKECRARRNNSMFVNTMSTCQPHYDGSNWNVYLYDVTQSQLTADWWVQVVANFTSASLAYTSYVKSETNNVVEYQNSYSVSLSAYNSSRSIPSKLSWLDNRYVLFFHQLQYKYLEAVTGQQTPYLRFRFRSIIGSYTSSYDYLRIYLPDNLAQEPFSPVNNHNDLVCQFLPATSSGDRDFSVGFSSRGTVKTASSAYYIEIDIQHGGINSGVDYFLQISEKNTATSSFYMPTTPMRTKIDWRYNYYPASSNWNYYDSFWIQSTRHFNFIQLLHTTTTVNDYETLRINYMPQGGLSTASSNNQIALRVSVEARYHDADGGITSIYTADGNTLLNGQRFSGWVSNQNGNEVTSINFAQYSIDNAPLRFSLARQSTYSDNTLYTFMLPLLKNPSTAYVALRYNISLVRSPSSSYEYVHNFYQSYNQYYTVADSSSSMTTSITNNLRAVQTVSNVDLSVNMGTYNLAQWDTAIFKINNALPGINPAISSPNDTSNYNYYYFKNIHMIMAQKKSTNTLSTVGIGASSSSINYQSTFGISWVRIFNNSNIPTTYNPYTLHYSTPATLTLTHLTTYTTSSVTLEQGYESVGSTAFYSTTFATPIIPEGGQIRVLFDKTKYSSDERLACRVGSGFTKSSNDLMALRCYATSQGFNVAGFAAISASTSAKIYFKLKSLASVTNSGISSDVIGIYQNNATRVSLAQVGTITSASSTVPNSLGKVEQTTHPYFATLHTDNYYEIEGTINLRQNTLLNSDYLEINEPGWTVRGSRRLLIRQNSSSITGWTELYGWYQSSNKYRFKLPQNNLIQQQITLGTQYIWRYTSEFSSSSSWSYYNGMVMGGPGSHKFQLQGAKSNTIVQSARFNFVPYARPFVMTINNRYKAAGRQTMLDFSFTVDVNLGSTDSIVFSFDTSNLLKQMFPNDVEGNAGVETYRNLDCRQWNNNAEVSDSRLVCFLQFGNNVANPPAPANLTIKFTKNFYGWSSSRTIRILVANVQNPTDVGLNTGVTVTINKQCENQHNLPCNTYEARGFYVTEAATQTVLTSSTTFTSSSSLVLTTGLTHTFTFTLTASIGSNDVIYIVYPENFQGVMPQNCTVSGYYCYVFPTRRWVTLIPIGTKGAGSTTISMTSMNNPYYAKPHSLNFKVTVARSGQTGQIYYILQNAFTPVSYSFASVSTATDLTVVPTQTPNYYLRNYANTVNFTISNVFSDKRVEAVYIKLSTDATVWDATYCNASITNTSNFNYPLRFTCIVDPTDATFLRLTRDSDMTTFDPLWATMEIKLHAKFTLADFPTAPILYSSTPVTSNPFYVYSSVNATHPSDYYYMSQASVTVSISQHQVPIISVVNFNTQSFANRLARVNNKEVFYLLFKPLNPVSIGKIVFTIPSQFNYPGVFSLDFCKMIGRTTILQTSCSLSRYQGQTLVTLVPTGYDNNVKIFQIGSVDVANWFTAPGLPGDFYNMNVAVYSTNGTLVAKQTRNISPVYGQNLDIPSIQIANVLDKETTFATYDLQFTTGNLQIPPGAPTTATTQKSQLQFVFENFNGMNPTNVFDNDLRTGLVTGDEVGCKIQSGLTALAGMRIKCILTVGTSQTKKPTISIINYNFIDPATTIIVTFAGIQTLPQTLVNTISIGATIYYTDIGSSTYLYIPTPIVTVPTNASNVLANTNSGWKSAWVANSSFSGINIVLQPTTFSISYRAPYNFIGQMGGLYNTNLTSYGQYSYSSTGAPDEFILLTFYPATLLDRNNPVTVNCGSCTDVDIFYTAGMVRFRHSTTTGSNNYRTFSFTNFPTSAFSILNEPINVFFQIFDQYQCIYSKNVTNNLPRTVEKCTKFTFGVVSVSSLNGGQIGVTYKFSIKTNHFVPSNGAISIIIPTQYGNMVANKATCTLEGFAGTNCYCRISTPSRIDIYSNGTQLSTTSTYSVVVTEMQNPNIDSSNFGFIVTSYYEDNIYLSKKICENQIIPPTINIKPLRTCSLSWNPQYFNQNFNASYVFQLSCSDVFRGDSILYISLPSAYSTTNALGSIPCTSYESTTLVTPTCTLSYINNVFTLSTSIDASSQSALSVIVNLVNPINNTYAASAYVTSKGTQYASASNSSIKILHNSYSTAQIKNVRLMNSPKEAGLSSTYIFKISPVSGLTSTNLGITFPSNFFIDSAELTVAIANTPNSHFFSSLDYNNIQALVSNSSAVNGIRVNVFPTFSVAGTSVYMSNITSYISSTKWSYVFISGVHNPSAYEYANFTVAYYLISSGFQSLQWAYQYPLTYYISAPPEYIAIDNVTVSDFDLLYPANYTFTFSSTTANIAVANKNLSYIIVIPTFYKSVLWANGNPTCKFTQLSAASSCRSYQGQIIITEVFTTNHTNLTLQISTLLNPPLATTCDTTDTTLLAQTFFVIRIIDTLSNSFLYESSSVVDSRNCLVFSQNRIPISLQYPLEMTAGLTYNITYGLSKAANNLKIKASVSNSGFTFSPEIVDFNDFYNLAKSTQVFLRSDVAAGSYVINFEKSQSSLVTYFRNILPVTITVKAATSVATANTPTISIPAMQDSTVGNPVILPLQFSIPSSTQMTMFLTVSEESNQTLAQYSPYMANFSIEPRIINILAQNTAYNFTIIQGMRVVPPPITLNFKITSNYPIVHQLTTPKMYLCFDRDPRWNVAYPPLRVKVTPFLSSCNQKDVGKAITNTMVSNASSESSSAQVKPKIIGIQVLSVASTGAQLQISSLTSGKIYWLCIPVGYAAITDAQVIIGGTNSNGISGSSMSSALTVRSGTTAQVNYLATASISGLSQTQGYKFYAVSDGNLGQSDIFSIFFNTTTLSNEVQMTLHFNSIVTVSQIKNALKEVMRIAPSRISVETSVKKLQDQLAASTSSDNSLSFKYDIIILPDPTNDAISPFSIVSSFANTKATLQKFQGYLPTFDISKTVTFFEKPPVLPILEEMPTVSYIKIDKASFKLKLKKLSTIYAVLYEWVGQGSSSLTIADRTLSVRKVKNLNATEQASCPSSNQIVAGTDHNNVQLGTYKVFQQNTNYQGRGNVFFSDLKEKSNYQVFITAASPRKSLPFLWDDGDVLTFTFSTLQNPNVGSSDKQMQSAQELSKYDPAMSAAIQKHIRLNSRKSKTTSGNANRRGQ